MTASERVGPVAEKITTIEEAKQAVVRRYGADACFLYKTRAGKLIIMDVDNAFEISGGHIQSALRSGNVALEQVIWQQLDRWKQGADKLRAQKPEAYQSLIESGHRLLEEWRVANGRPNAK